MNFSIAAAEWKTAWQLRAFRFKTWIVVLSLMIILSCFSIFFHHIEQRQGGTLLNDWVLNMLPPHDVSIFIFLLIWATVGLGLLRAIGDPHFFLVVLYGYAILCVARFISISLVALEPPAGLIPLVDPLSNFFYGKKFVTKDLFFSGHTSTLFVIAFSFLGKKDRIFGFLAASAVGILVLIQHIHYTVDVITAPIFSFIAYKIAEKVSFLQ
jgi:PAP2 superfamily C-terminal